MHTNMSDVSIKPIKVKSEARMSTTSRQLTRQASVSNSANEVYYGDSSVSIPFRWESQPGTPRVNFHERRQFPPLTPPPSYQCNPARKSVRNHSEAVTSKSSGVLHKSSGVLHTVLPKLNLIKKSNMVQSSSSFPSLSSSSSSSSLSSSPWSSSSPSVNRSSPFRAKSKGGQQRRRLLFSPRTKDKDDDEDEDESPVSSLCFGAGRNSSNVRSRGCPASFLKLLLGQYA